MSKTWYDAATQAGHVQQYHQNVFWVGIAMGEFDKAHQAFKNTARIMRKRGYKARVVTLPEGSPGINGTGANLVKRSVIIVPSKERSAGNYTCWYDLMSRLEKRFW